MLSHVQLLGTPGGLWPTRLLCPWHSPGKNTGVGSHSLLQGIFLSQGSNLHLLCWQADSLPSELPGKTEVNKSSNRNLSFPHSSVSKESSCNIGELYLIPGSGRSPREGNSNPLQYFRLRNHMDTGAWYATVHGGHKRFGHDLATKQQHTSFIHGRYPGKLSNSPKWPKLLLQMTSPAKDKRRYWVEGRPVIGAQ